MCPLASQMGETLNEMSSRLPSLCCARSHSAQSILRAGYAREYAVPHLYGRQGSATRMVDAGYRLWLIDQSPAMHRRAARGKCRGANCFVRTTRRTDGRLAAPHCGGAWRSRSLSERGADMSDLQIDDRGFIMACPSCGQRNRVAFSAREARCGRCKSALTPPSEPIEVPDARVVRRTRARRAAAGRRRFLGAVVRPVPHGRAGAGTGRRLERRTLRRRQGQHGRAAGARRALPHSIDPDDGGLAGGRKSRARAARCRRRRLRASSTALSDVA